MKSGFKGYWLICLLVLYVFAPLKAIASDTLIVNGDFERVESGLVESWQQESYQPGSNVSNMTIESGQAHAGSHFIRIHNLQPNDARWVQKVKVNSNKLYKLTSWVRASGIGQDRTGANISVLGVGATSVDMKDTGGEWKLVQFYGKTGDKQTEIVVAARLGGYGSLNTGTADFDDFTIEEVEKVPPGTRVVSFAPNEQPSTVSNQPATNSHTGYNISSIAFAILYLLICIRVFKYAGGVREGILPINKPGINTVIVLLAGAFLIRMIGAPILQGHPIDFMDFNIWSNHVYKVGLSEFYNAQMFVDYPPGYIYVLYIIGMIKHLFSISDQSSAAIILIKLPSMVADLLSAYIIYLLAKKRWNEQAAIVFTCLYALNPLVYLNSTIWGQIDSIYTLIVLLMVYALTENKVPLASVLFIISFLIKPQSIIFTPLLLFSLLQQKLKTWIYAVGFGLLSFVAIVLPFAINKKPLWIVEHYKAMFLSYPLASLNAANIYTLFGLNGAQASREWLSMDLSSWGNAGVLVIVVFIGYLFFKSRESSKYFYLAFLTSLLIFVFKTGMHERYGYPVVLLALISYLTIRDKRILYLFIGLSLTQFANVAYVLKLSLDKMYYISNHDSFFKLISFANVGLALYAAYLGVDMYVKKRILLFEQISKGTQGVRNILPTQKRTMGQATNPTQPLLQHVLNLTKLDKIIVSVLTLVYLCVALYQLGSFKAPESYWKPEMKSEGFYIDFGKKENISKVMWYGGLGNGDFQIEQSNDAVQWTPVQNVKLDGGTVFQWKQSPVQFSAQFVKIVAVTPGASLMELAFKNNEQLVISIAKLVPLSTGKPDMEQAQKLFDEQQTVPTQPSFMNSMYFDEIYHGRTAYEHLHHIEPLETTHPPLGKVLISMGIAIFGMNPFGWRIVGTLFGIAMIPLMYVFAKRLFGKTEYAFMAACMLTFDFMHFTQTRIATIDVYGVFFIMLMYYFMYKYYTLSQNGASLKTSLIPLGLSGLFFGIGAACKWIDIYAGGGLAVILLLVWVEKYKTYRQAISVHVTKKQGNNKAKNKPVVAQADDQIASFPRQFWITTGFCCITFVAIPAVIYVLSYIPFMLVQGPGHDLKAVFSYQKFMFNYHNQLVATHPFSSVWWQWPLILKPIWYYGQVSLPPGKMSSIVAMGNPAVWWVGTVAVLASITMWFKRKDKLLTFLLIGLAAQYLPWIGVSRLTFLYHFFASVPFLILCTTYMMKELVDRSILSRKWMYVYLGSVLLLFILFYPILSGAIVSKTYVTEVLKWFPKWIFNA